MSLLTDPPDLRLAARLRGVRSSPVREILALTEQPGVISFAGGLPAPELFDAEGLREAFAAALAGAAVAPVPCDDDGWTPRRPRRSHLATTRGCSTPSRRSRPRRGARSRQTGAAPCSRRQSERGCG